MKELKKIGERLQSFMEEKNVGVNELGRLTKTSGAQIHNIIKGKNYGIGKLINILKVFDDLSVEWLINGVNTGPKPVGGKVDKDVASVNEKQNLELEKLIEENSRLKTELEKVSSDLDFQKLIIEAHKKTIDAQEGSIADLKQMIELIKDKENRERKKTA